MNKADQLEALIFTYDPHVIMISETWLHEGIQNSEVVPPNYRLIRKDRCSRGGGVAIAIKENFVYQLMERVGNTESVWCKLNFFGAWITLGTVYKKPGSSSEELTEIIDYLIANTNARTKLVIGGDFNAPNVSWSQDGVASLGTNVSESLLELAFSRGLRQVVTEPTRVTGTSCSLLDLLFVSNDFDDCNVFVHDGISDHKMVFFKCNMSVCHANPAQVKMYYDFERANDESVVDHLEQYFDGFDQMTDVNEMWLRFRSAVNHCIINFIPQKQKKIKRQNPWITREILHAKRKLKRLRKHHSHDVCEQAGNLKRKIKSAKETYFTKSLPEFLLSAPEKFWRYLSPVRSSITQLCINGDSVSDKAKIAIEFNRYFQSVFTRESSNHNTIPCRDNVSSLISEQGILSLLRSLDAKKSPGPDALPNAFLKRYAEWVAKYLSCIFTRSIQDAVLPDDWLVARVVPVKKSGKGDSVENYRPISLTCASCKLLEHIVNKHLVSFLESKGTINPSQHGFRVGLSTVTQLIEFYHELSTYVNDRTQVDAVFIDLSKAFDRVPHRKLVKVLIDLEVPSYIISWINAYLTNRQQFVDVNGAFSGLLDVHSGVPQGSVLGPLLFLIYVNSLFSISTSGPIKIRMFADDCVIYTPVYSVEDQINLSSTLSGIASWCQDYNMMINVHKTQYMHVSTKKTVLTFNYVVCGFKLTNVESYKYLGVIIASDLKWSKHVEYIRKRATNKLWFLKRTLGGAPPSVRLLAYKTIIRPILEYASAVWDPWQCCLVKELEDVQSLAARVIFSDFRRTTSVTGLKTKANLQLLINRRACQRVKLFFQIYNNLLKIDGSKYLKPRTFHSQRLHHSKMVAPINARINAFKQSFFVRTIELWNKLPSEIVNLDSFSIFSNALDAVFEC